MKKYYLITTYINDIACIDEQQLYIFDTLKQAQKQMKEFYFDEIKTCEKDSDTLCEDECWLDETYAEIRYDDSSSSRWWLKIIAKESEE